MSAVAICLCLLVCLVWLGNWNWLSLPPEKHAQDYQFAVKMIGLSCMIQSSLRSATYFTMQCFKWKLPLDFVFHFFKMGVIAITAYFYPKYTIYAAAYGELATVIVLIVVNSISFVRGSRKKPEEGMEESFNTPLVKSAMEFLRKNCFPSLRLPGGALLRGALKSLIEGLLELLYVDGEKYVMTFAPVSFAEQGIFVTFISVAGRTASYLGNTLKKEISPFYYRRLCYTAVGKTTKIKLISMGMFKFHRLAAIFAYVALVFGLPYVCPFSRIFTGNLLDGWQKISLLAKTMCVITSLKIIDHATEAYRSFAGAPWHGKSYKVEVRELKCIYLVISAILVYFIGAMGIAFTCCCYYGLIILHSIWLIHRDCEGAAEKPLLGLLRNKKESLAFVAALAVTSWSEWFIYPYSFGLHLSVGVFCAAFVTRTIVFAELDGWSELYSFFRQTFHVQADIPLD